MTAVIAIGAILFIIGSISGGTSTTKSYATSPAPKPQLETKTTKALKYQKQISDIQNKITDSIKKEKHIVSVTWDNSTPKFPMLNVSTNNANIDRNAYMNHICKTINDHMLTNPIYGINPVIVLHDSNASTVKSACNITPETLSKIASIKKKEQELQKITSIRNRIEHTIDGLKKFNKFNDYKHISMPALNDRVQKMRSFGKEVFFTQDEAKKDKSLYKLWKQARAMQIKTQVRHYPKMRDRVGPLLRDKMWEHNIEAKTIGRGYTRLVLTGGIFASNMAIKEFQESISIMLHDYRFKRVDYKWMKHASEWTYFSIDSKKDNQL